MNEFEQNFITEKRPKNRLVIFFLVCFLGFSIGLAFGFYLGMSSLITIIGDLTENMTVIVDFDEDKAIDYAYAIAEEQYGDLATGIILGNGIEDLNLTEDEEEKIKAIINSSSFDMVIENIDEETLAMIEQLKEHPEDRDINKQILIGG